MEQIDRKMLICVGAQRGGTTWLAKQLRSHQSLYFAPLKEVRYFSDCLLPYEKVLERKIRAFRSVVSNLIESDLPANKKKMDIDWFTNYTFSTPNQDDLGYYSSLWEMAQPSQILCDFSPDYSFFPKIIFEKMAKQLPNSKVIFSIRNPIDRQWSGATYAAANQRSKATQEELLDYAQRIVFNADHSCFSDMTKIINALEKNYAKSNIHYIFHKDIKEKSEEVLSGIYEFLELPKPNYSELDLEGKINTSPRLVIPQDVKLKLTESHQNAIDWLKNKFDRSEI